VEGGPDLGSSALALMQGEYFSNCLQFLRPILACDTGHSALLSNLLATQAGAVWALEEEGTSLSL
jgi:hypothetical protein